MAIAMTSAGNSDCCPGPWGCWSYLLSSGRGRRRARRKVLSKSDKDATSRSFRHNMLLDTEGDVYDFYEHLETIGEGSISTISKVRKRVVGGSARYSSGSGTSRRASGGRTKRGDTSRRASGGSLFGRRSSKAESVVSPLQKTPGDHELGDSLRFGTQAVDADSSRPAAAKTSNDNVTVKQQQQQQQQGKEDETESSSGGGGDDNQYIRSHNEMIFALKSIHLRVVNDAYMKELRNEVEVLKTLDHPNIVRAYETFQKKKNIYLIMEHLTGGDLHTRHPYTEREAATIVGKMLSAIVYMHKKRIIHRDIKYENIIFESSKPNAEPKLIDFGLSKAYLGPNFQLTETVGTVYTMAPEVLLGNYSFKADMWSLGVVTYMLLCGAKPFWGHNKKRIVEKIMRARVKFRDPNWRFVSKEAREFVLLLLQRDPEKRPTAEEAQAHAWLHNEYKLSNRRPKEDVMHRVNASLVAYAESGEFKKVALNVIAHKSTAEQIFQIRSAFDQYDANNDGAISYKGFKAALSKFNYTEEELGRMFRSVDVNDDGCIFFTEFLAATLETMGRIEEHRLAEAFDRLDEDDTGYISRENLRHILGRKCTEDYLERLMAEVDADRNGRITYSEFLAVFMQQKREEIQEIYDADDRVATIRSTIDGEDSHSSFGSEMDRSTGFTFNASSDADRIRVGVK